MRLSIEGQNYAEIMAVMRGIVQHTPKAPQARGRVRKVELGTRRQILQQMQSCQSGAARLLVADRWAKKLGVARSYAYEILSGRIMSE